MDFQSLKQKIDSIHFTVEQSESFRIYNHKRKLAAMCFAFSVLDIIIMLLLLLTFHINLPSVVFVGGFLAFPISFFLGVSFLKKANTTMREKVFLGLIFNFLPHSFIKEEKFSLENWGKADNYQAFPGNIIKNNSNGKEDIASHIHYENERFYMKFQFIEVGSKRRVNNSEKWNYTSLFRGRIGHFSLKRPMQNSFSVHPLMFHKLFEKGKSSYARNTFKKGLEMFQTMKDFNREDYDKYVFPSFLEKTSVEHFILSYQDYFKRQLHVVAKQNEVFLYEEESPMWEEGNKVQVNAGVFKNAGEEDIKDELLRILSYVWITEELLRMHNVN